ncbi:MAG TPA: nitroreductase/quinone reductase family protein [Thermoleophilaceae bacterium]|jgi:deazaflavin-dependent oxidoreductase (nitroreductase family)
MPSRSLKHRIVHLVQKYLANPPVRLSFRLGINPPGYALLETRGRKSGKPRTTPVGDGLVGDTFWIVSEHGRRAGYIRNIQHDPRVRLKLRRGLKQSWRTGTAEILPDDDTRERQRMIARGNPSRALNAFVVRTLGTDLLTVRVDLDPP